LARLPSHLSPVRQTKKVQRNAPNGLATRASFGS
jgi:hypothetical protein